MQFSIRDVLWFTALVSCLVCWYLERDGRLTTSQRYLATYQAKQRLELELAEARAENVEVQRELVTRLKTLEEIWDELLDGTVK